MKKERPSTVKKHAGRSRASRINGSGQPASRWRRWGFRLVAISGVPLALLVLVETLLRLAGIGHQTDFLVHHPAAGDEVLVENQRFPWRFFPPTLARHPQPLNARPGKPEGVCRILVLGASAAEGDPAPAFGFSRILEVLLEARHPGVDFEVINTAFTAINSNVVLPIARDCRQLEADVWLIYLGNNEVVGPFGTGTVFGPQIPPMTLIRASLWVRNTRLGQLLDGLLRRLRESPEAAQGWGGMTMFAGQQVPRNDPRLATVREHFRENLEGIVRAGRSSGAQVVVSTVVSRVRDWPPFGSLHRPDLGEAERDKFEQEYQAGVAAERSAAWEEAIQSYQQASQMDADYAELHYRWGRCALALGHAEEAREHLLLARELDTLRFRSDTALNEQIRLWMATQPSEGARLLDAERAFERASPEGLPGREWFHEHVHFTFAGNYLLARLFAEATEDLLPPFPDERPPAASQRASAWLSEADCAARLGYSEVQHYEILRLIQRRFQEGIYRSQAGYAERMAALETELTEQRGLTKPTARRRALEVCREALSRDPEDWVLHELAARLLGGLDEYSQAALEWKEVVRRIPHAADPYTQLGRLSQIQRRPDEALAWFDRAIEVNPDWAKAWVGRGEVHAEQGHPRAAESDFRRALALDPTRQAAREGLKRLGSGDG
jgi:tetratricopeptide (TPR) repeat protein